MKNVVLLVDDDENVLRGLARTLRKEPYQLYTARSGEEAVWTLKTNPVDVIVTDERMPGMSGSDLLSWMAENYPDVTRIVLTGYATPDTIIRAINEGAAYCFLTKPCDEGHLAMTIRKALEHKRLLDDNRRLAQQTKRQLRELEHFAQELDILTHTVSHDLQQPLQTVSRSCQSLGEKYDDLFDPKARALVGDALEATADVRDRLDKLLQLTRANSHLDPSNECLSTEGSVPSTSGD